MEQLEGRVGVVTGAASGIGLGIARAFAGAGMKLVITDVDEAALGDVVAEMTEGGASVFGVRTDVGDSEAVQRLAAAAYERHDVVDVLVNNAGVIASGNTWELPLSEWQRVLQVNLWGVICGVHAFLPRMLERKEPAHILNIGSMASGHPTMTEVRVELEAVDGGTKMVMTHSGIPSDSPGASGWAMAFDKLGTRVRQLTADQN